MSNIVKYSEFNYLSINEEKAWDNIKYGLSKLGRYKAGGKILGKGKVTREAQAEIEELLKKASNSTLKKLRNTISEVAPEFPNDRKPETFLKGVEMIAATYDSIKAATKKDEKEEGYLDPIAANELIEGLRKIVKKYADIDLKGIYTTFESNDYDYDYELLNEEEILGKIGKGIKKGASKIKAAKDKAMDKAFGERDTRKNVETIRGGKKGLESNRLPILLSALGASLAAAGWMAQTDWFKDMVTEVHDLPPQEIEEVVKTTVEKNITVDGRGLSYTIQNNLPSDMDIKLGPNASVEDLKSALSYYGDGDQKEGIKFISQFIDPSQREASIANLTEQLSDPSNKTVGDIFNQAEGTYGTRGGLFSQYGGAKAAIAKFVATRVVKKMVTTGAKVATTSAVGGTLMALSPVLLGVGIGLVGAGVLLKLMREKGLRQSRFATLNTLLQNLELVDVPEDKKTSEKESDEDVDKLTEKSLYPAMIKNLTALRNILRNYKDVSIEGESEGEESDRKSSDSNRKEFYNKKKSGDLQVGKIYNYTNKKGETKKVKLISLKNDISAGDDKKYLTSDDITGDTLAKGAVQVISKDKQGNFTNKSPKFAVNKQQLSESFVYDFLTFSINEKDRFGKTSKATIGSNETYLTESFKKLKRSIKLLEDSKDKGIAIDEEFLNQVLEEKMKAKETIKNLFSEIYEHMYGKYSKTMPELDSLYKESVKVIEDNTKVVAEKMARFAKRSIQFEGEGFYSGLAKLGDNLEDYNTTFKQIMDYLKSE